MEEILFENLDYGAYILQYENGSFTENIKFASAAFNKLNVRRVRLPDGKGNIIYLLSESFETTMNMLTSNNFIIPSMYKKLFYPQRSIGKFMGKQYRMNVKGLAKDRTTEIKKRTKFTPYTVLNLPDRLLDNLFFITSDIYEAVKPILEKLSVKRNYEEFYSSFLEVIKGISPEENEKLTGVNDNKRILIIDAEAFNFNTGGSLNDNKTNPLFLIYLAWLRTRDLSKINADMDMLICYRNLFVKFNPSQITDSKKWNVFRLALFKILNANLDDYTKQLSEEERISIATDGAEKIVTAVVNDTIEPFTKMVSPETKSTLTHAVKDSLNKKITNVQKLDEEIKKSQDGPRQPTEFSKSGPKQSSLMHVNPIRNPLDSKLERLYKSIGTDYEPLSLQTGMQIDDDEDEEDYDDFERSDLEEYEDGIKDDVNEILTSEEEVAAEVLDDIQDRNLPLKNIKTAPLNSARDKKLREEQKKVVVRTETIEQILSRDIENVPIEEDDKSAVMHTSNKNMYHVRFANFDKTYIDKLYTKDIVACFDNLKDKDNPFYITNIEIKDSSDALNYKETWIVHLKDETGKRHTVRVDIPKFQNDRFMLINGTRWIILKQNFYNPLVKDTPDTVIMTTNFNKVTIKRKATKSITSSEKIFALMRKTGDSKLFITGDSSRGNMKYISSLEYDELSKKIFRFKSKGCTIYFSRDYINENMSEIIPLGSHTNINPMTSGFVKGNEFFIGIENNTPILVNEDTGLDRAGRTIAEIIEANLSDENKAIYNSIKPPTQLMYVEGKLAGEFIPIITTLIVWNGLTESLNKMGINWRFMPDVKRLPPVTSSKKYIRFSNGVLEYDNKIFAELILNGLNKMHPEKFMFEDFDTEAGYEEFVFSQWGSYNGITELRNFREFLVDPITGSYCRDLMLPDDASGLLIHAVKLLSDNAYVSKASDQSYRTRSIEMIPAILYSCLAKQYKAHVNSGRMIPMTLNQKCVIQALIAEKTVEAYSTLNPVIEVSKTHTISTKGYKGSNSEHSYDEEKRSYDPSSVGKIAITSSPDANVGINKSLVIEPTITNARGYREQVDDIEALKDVNLFAPSEMLTPGTIRNDDPIRSAIATKQSSHVVPVADASPSLISNGYDEAVQFHLSDDFVINAKEDGKVIDVNDELGFIIVEYKSGKKRAINTKPEIVKNSGGGFYMSNQLKPVYTKVGQKFKKDEPLAYHPKYFKLTKMNGLRYSIGPIAKMAFVSSYNTYEDAGICTEQLADRMATNIVYQVTGKFKRNNNILDMVKIGDHVNIGDSLIRYDVSVEDNELSKYLSKLSEENAGILEEETRNDIKTDHAGKVIDIKVYTILDPSNLSPSLANIVQKYFNEGNMKKEYLEQFDDNPGIMKAGYLLTDTTEPIKNRYNSIKGNKGVDVLIEIHIEHQDIMGVGDKVALYSANKQIISQLIPKGWEPYSEFRPDEEISVISSPGTIARRMTSSVLPISAGMKVLIEMKRKIKKEIKYK